MPWIFYLTLSPRAPPTLLAESDHKGVILALEPPQATREGVKGKFCYPDSFLSDAEIVQGLLAELEHLGGEGLDWWALALGAIKRVALEFQADQPKRKGSGRNKSCTFFYVARLGVCRRRHILFYRTKDTAPRVTNRHAPCW